MSLRDKKLKHLDYSFLPTIYAIEHKDLYFEFDGDAYKGVGISTSRGDIGIGICDEWLIDARKFFVSSEDDYKKFKGAQILAIKTVNNCIDEINLLNKLRATDFDLKLTMFVNVETTAGVIQFVMGNLGEGSYYIPAKIVLDRKTIIFERTLTTNYGYEVPE